MKHISAVAEGTASNETSFGSSRRDASNATYSGNNRSDNIPLAYPNVPRETIANKYTIPTFLQTFFTIIHYIYVR